jgi:hypothetical protein
MRTPVRKATKVLLSLGWSLPIEDYRRASEFYNTRLGQCQILLQLEPLHKPDAGNIILSVVRKDLSEYPARVIKEVDAFRIPLRTMGIMWHDR